MMTSMEFAQYVAEGRSFWMRKYLAFDRYSTPRLVSSEVADRKSRVRTEEDYCPYTFELAE